MKIEENSMYNHDIDERLYDKALKWIITTLKKKYTQITKKAQTDNSFYNEYQAFEYILSDVYRSMQERLE
jgi:hypothetical protein